MKASSKSDLFSSISENRDKIPKQVVKDGLKWLMVPSKIMFDGFSIWPERQNKITAILNCICIFSSIFFVVGNLYYVSRKETDMGSASVSLSLLIPGVEFTTRITFSYIYKERFAKLVSQLYFEFWPSDFTGNTIQRAMAKQAKYLFMYCASYTFVSFMSGMQFVIGPHLNGDLPFRTAYPFSWQKSPYYEILYIWQSFYLMLEPLLICGWDMFYVSLVFNCVGQFKMLAVYLRRNFEETVKNTESCSKTRAREIVIYCIKRHNKLIRICNEINAVSTYYILLQYMFSVGTVCLSSFTATVVPEEFGSAVTYLMGHMCLQFVYCYMGNELLNESTELSNAAYQCGWHLTYIDKDLKKSLMMIMIRSQKPIVISAGGFGILSLSGFMKLIQFSFSIYTLLKTILKNQNTVL